MPDPHSRECLPSTPLGRVSYVRARGAPAPPDCNRCSSSWHAGPSKIARAYSHAILTLPQHRIHAAPTPPPHQPALTPPSRPHHAAPMPPSRSPHAAPKPAQLCCNAVPTPSSHRHNAAATPLQRHPHAAARSPHAALTHRCTQLSRSSHAG